MQSGKEPACLTQSDVDPWAVFDTWPRRESARSGALSARAHALEVGVSGGRVMRVARVGTPPECPLLIG